MEVEIGLAYSQGALGFIMYNVCLSLNVILKIDNS